MLIVRREDTAERCGDAFSKRQFSEAHLGAIASTKALEERDKLRRRMEPAQLLEAELRSVEWLQDNPGQ